MKIKNNKNNFLIFIFFLIFLTINIQADIFKEFEKNIQDKYLNPFLRDFNGILCGNIAFDANNLDFFRKVPLSLGFKLGILLTVKEIDKDNRILKDYFENADFKYIFLPIVQMEKGLPYNTDLIIRYVNANGSVENEITVYGLGIKHKFFSFPKNFKFINFSFSIFYNFFEVKKLFQINSFSTNFFVSLNKFNFFAPYIFIGIDNAELKVYEEVYITSTKGKLNYGLRYGVGFNFYLPFFYINLGYSNIYNTNSYNVGLGLKF